MNKASPANNLSISIVDPTSSVSGGPGPGQGTCKLLRPTPNAFNAATGGSSGTLPNYLLWMIFLFFFSYLGSNVPIWRFAQPVNYIGFWIMLITIVLSFTFGALVAPLTGVSGSAGNIFGISR